MKNKFVATLEGCHFELVRPISSVSVTFVLFLKETLIKTEIVIMSRSLLGVPFLCS